MSSKPKPTITPTPDGPYVVKGLERCSNQKGPIETSGTMALCRCGQSARKPFCDGSHKQAGFSSARSDDRSEDRLDSYAGKKVTIHDNRSICAHAGYCTDRLATVFRMSEEPWIHPDSATADEIIGTINMCPSGALSYSLDDLEYRDRGGTPVVFVSPNGPYVVSGGPELVDTHWAKGASREHYTLCRCGASKNKPFCDGSHWEVGFTDEQN